MIIQQRLTSRSSRSLAVMIGFAQPAGSRGTWRCDGDIDSGGRLSRSPLPLHLLLPTFPAFLAATAGDRKSTRLNSSHLVISYAVFCLKKKNIYSCRLLQDEFPPIRKDYAFRTAHIP